MFLILSCIKCIYGYNALNETLFNNLHNLNLVVKISDQNSGFKRFVFFCFFLIRLRLNEEVLRSPRFDLLLKISSNDEASEFTLEGRLCQAENFSTYPLSTGRENKRQ